MRPAPLAVPALALTLALLVGCAAPPYDPTSGDGVFAVEGGDPEHPRLRYADGQLSPNDTCVIRLENGLNPRVPPLFVNGVPLGFC